MLAGETAVGAAFAGGDVMTVTKPGGPEAGRHGGKQRSAGHVGRGKVSEARQYASGAGLAVSRAEGPSRQRNRVASRKNRGRMGKFRPLRYGHHQRNLLVLDLRRPPYSAEDARKESRAISAQRGILS